MHLETFLELNLESTADRRFQLLHGAVVVSAFPQPTSHLLRHFLNLFNFWLQQLSEMAVHNILNHCLMNQQG